MVWSRCLRKGAVSAVCCARPVVQEWTGYAMNASHIKLQICTPEAPPARTALPLDVALPVLMVAAFPVNQGNSRPLSTRQLCVSAVASACSVLSERNAFRAHLAAFLLQGDSRALSARLAGLQPLTMTMTSQDAIRVLCSRIPACAPTRRLRP